MKVRKIFTAALCVAMAAAAGMTGCSGDVPLLRDVYSDYFLIGTSCKKSKIEAQSDLLAHFNSVTPEYEMKWGIMEPDVKGEYNWAEADNVVAWAKDNGKVVRGHSLIWYQNVPAWLEEEATDKERTLELIDEHIETVMTHFGDEVVYCWDVVNEAIVDSPTAEQVASGDFYRTEENDPERFGDGFSSPRFDFGGMCGRDYVFQAFRSADRVCREYGYDDMKLFYNDWFMYVPLKRDAFVEMVGDMRAEGVRIDGVGMQCHLWLSDYLADKQTFLSDIEQAIKTYTALGLEVQITELEVIVGENLSREQEEQQAELYGKVFEIFRKYASPWQEGAGCITNVTLWSMADDAAVKNYVFDINHKPKKAYYQITDFYYNQTGTGK